jgi:hypothetical protein
LRIDDILREKSEQIFCGQLSAEQISAAVSTLSKRAKTYLGQGEDSLAIKCLEEALELRPDDETIRQQLVPLKEGQPLKHIVSKESTEKPKALIDKLGTLVSEISFQCSAYTFDTVKGTEQRRSRFAVGEPIIIYVEAPKVSDGHLTVIHYDDEYNLGMLFPNKKSDSTLVKPGQEKRLGLQAGKPTGRHYLKAIWTSEQIIKPEIVDFEDKSNVGSCIDDLLNSISDLSERDWMVSYAQFEVIDS